MGNYLQLYKEFCEEITDAPPNYHDYIGLLTVSLVLGNQIYLPFGDTRIYPNLWMILLGSSSFSRKTTAINIGKRLVSEICPDRIYPNEFSHEKIQGLFKERPAGCFFFSEFVTLMGLLSRDYLSATKGFLTDLYDSPYAYTRETLKSTVTILNPAISIASATTQEWFTDKMKESDVLGGFIPRFLMVMPSKKTRSIGIPPMADQTKRETLKYYLQNFKSISGVCVLTKEVSKSFESWYEILAVSNGSARLDPFLNRLQIYTLKIAMILNVINEDNLKITKNSLEQAISMMQNNRIDLLKIEKEDFVFNGHQRNSKKVIDYLRRKGKQSRSDIMNNTNLSAREMKETLETLQQSERIREIKVKGKTKTTSYYDVVKTDEDDHVE